MSGVGSTNAMKKGSANNPFIAFSEADMKGYLNSAYTGCIVKYNGDSIARNLSDVNKTVPERAQSLVFKVNKNILKANWGCLKITTKSNGTETVQYLRTFFYNRYTGKIGWRDGLDWIPFLAICNTQHPTSVSDLGGLKILWVPTSYETDSDNYPEYWPVTLGWQGENADADGKVMLWGYSEDVSFVYLEDGKDSYISYDDIPCAITPYSADELYKVVYVDNEYRYEEFHYISEDKTTAGVEDVAPGKTFYDFTGTKQIGTGTRANPFLARSDADMNAFNNATYLGKFVKYIGKTNNTYVKDAIYQVTNDATEYDRYMLLPTLENEGQATDLAKGKQLINSQGEVVEGNAPAQGDVVAKYIQRQLTEFVTSDYISAIGYSNYSEKDVYMTFSNQSMLTKFDCQNIGKIWAGAFANCSKLSYLKLAEDVDIEGRYYDGRWNPYLGFPAQMRVNDVYGNVYMDFGTSDDKYANLFSMYTGTSSVRYSPKRILPGAIIKNRYVKMISWSTVKYASPLAIISCAYLSDLSLPNLISVPYQFVQSCQSLKQVNIENCKVIGRYAFATNYGLEKVICPNVEQVLSYAFQSASKLTEPYSFPKCKIFRDPYSTAISISSVYLPEAVDVEWYNGCRNIESVYMPKVERLSFGTNKITSLSLPECKSLHLAFASTLKNVYAPKLQTLREVAGCSSLEELDFPEVIYASSSYNSSLQYLAITGCTSLKTVSFEKYSGEIYISSTYSLETINCPVLKKLTLYSCSNLKGINCPAVTSMSVSAIVSSNFTINIDSDDYRYCSLQLSNAEGNLYNVDVNILNVNMSYRACSIHIKGDAINNLYVSIPVDAQNYTNFTDWTMSEVRKFSLSSNVRFMPNGWFKSNSRLTDVNLFNVSIISNNAFNLCENISIAYMPETVSISTFVFGNCNKLEYVILLKSSCKLGDYAFDKTPMSSTSYLGHYGSIYVPASFVSSYKISYGWSNYSSRITSITDLPQELKDKYGLNGVE